MQQLAMKNDAIKVSQSLIKQMLRLTGLAPSTFGQKSGVSPSTVTRALKGELKGGVDMKTLVALADEAGVEITLSRNHNRYQTDIDIELIRLATKTAILALRDEPDLLGRLPDGIAEMCVWIVHQRQGGATITTSSEALERMGILARHLGRGGSQE
jgi:transcriptional regulator with XRE-family HTH domain